MIEDSKQYSIVVSGKQLDELIQLQVDMKVIGIRLEYQQASLTDALPIMLNGANLLDEVFKDVSTVHPSV